MAVEMRSERVAAAAATVCSILVIIMACVGVFLEGRSLIPPGSFRLVDLVVVL